MKPEQTTEELKAELDNLVRRMHAVSSATYALFYNANMGGEVHAFIEFNGLIAKYVDICERAAAEGIDFRFANTHTGVTLPIRSYDLEYMAEKLGCIFGPALAQLPESEKQKFLDAIVGREHEPEPHEDETS